MRLCFNIVLPDTDLRVGEGLDTMGRSLKGYSNRQLKRFYPVVLCLETLTKINVWHLRRFAAEGKTVAPLYESGVFYQSEPPGEEEWLDIPSLYKQGFGDCEDLACARVAELQVSGIPAVPAIRHKRVSTPRGPVTLIHVLVLWPDGHVEDPSKMLGMRGEY